MNFTEQEVVDLLEHIKTFNAGAIDKMLDRHIDMCYASLVMSKAAEKKGFWAKIMGGCILACVFATGCTFSGSGSVGEPPIQQVPPSTPCPGGVCPPGGACPVPGQETNPFIRIGGPKRSIEVGPEGIDIETPLIDIETPKVEEHSDPANPNNKLGTTSDGTEIRGPVKTIHLERD